MFLLWNFIAVFSLAYLEIFGYLRVAATVISVDFCIGGFFFNFIPELMSTTNSCADKPILLGDTLLPEQLADGLSRRGLEGNKENVIRRVGLTYLKPGSSIFLVVFSVMPHIFTRSS